MYRIRHGLHVEKFIRNICIIEFRIGHGNDLISCGEILAKHFKENSLKYTNEA